jgi:hypothetical protein
MSITFKLTDDPRNIAVYQERDSYKSMGWDNPLCIGHVFLFQGKCIFDTDYMEGSLELTREELLSIANKMEELSGPLRVNL